MASVGPLEAWWSKNARMSWRRRHRVRPRWATSSSPAGTPRRIESITAARSRLPRRRLGSPVGGDDLLIDHVGHLHGVVLIGVEHAGQAVMLAGREQLDSGARDASDRALTGRHVLKSPSNRATQGRDTRRNPPVIRHPPPRCLKETNGIAAVLPVPSCVIGETTTGVCNYSIAAGQPSRFGLRGTRSQRASHIVM